MDLSSTHSGLSSGFLSQFVSEKLNHSNFLTWKRQIIPFIRSQDLSGHLDESTLAPLQFITQEIQDDKGVVSSRIIQNPDFTTWMKRDQALVAYITSTLSQEILIAIPDDCSATEL